MRLIILDIVLFEAISVIAKRLNERGLLEEVPDKIERLLNFLKDKITWTSGIIESWFEQIVEIVKSSKGALNFNDAFIVLFCEKNMIEYVLSFDTDFDSVSFVKRIS